jgi:hypothetical protein
MLVRFYISKVSILLCYARCHPVGPQRLEWRNFASDYLEGHSTAE